MKWLLIGVVILAILGGLFLQTGGFTRITPVSDSAGWDGHRRAFRQVRVTVADDDGNSAQHGITLFGDGRAILEPWLDIDFSMDACTLQGVDGRRTSLEAGQHVGWQTAAGEWTFVAGPFADLEPFEKEWGTVDLDSDLFEELRTRFPEHRELLHRIENGMAGGVESR